MRALTMKTGAAAVAAVGALATTALTPAQAAPSGNSTNPTIGWVSCSGTSTTNAISTVTWSGTDPTTVIWHATLGTGSTIGFQVTLTKSERTANSTIFQPSPGQVSGTVAFYNKSGALTDTAAYTCSFS